MATSDRRLGADYPKVEAARMLATVDWNRHGTGTWGIREVDVSIAI